MCKPECSPSGFENSKPKGRNLTIATLRREHSSRSEQIFEKNLTGAKNESGG